jgi:hypothetical protein
MHAEPVGSAEYRGSHRGLLRPIPRFSASRPAHPLDAIVVPTSRSLKRQLPGLELAVGLAQQMECSLFVLCSGNAHEQDFPEGIRKRLGARLEAWQVEHEDRAALPLLSSSRNRLSRLYRSSDLGLKRNLALALASASGWSRLLFIDDDITPDSSGETLDGDRLKDALQAMHADIALRAVGWPVSQFPDNSVVGHTRRLVNQEQKTFVGGGALLVRCDNDVPFFPDIFNEDWLFLIATAMASPDYRRSIGIAGSVGQLSYNPYRVIRAKAEEAGDIIGEGLMNLLEDDGPACMAQGKDPSYWSEAKQARATLIRELDAAVSSVESSVCQKVLTTLSAARGVHDLITPQDISGYVNDWLGDLPEWRDHVAGLATDLLARRHEPAPTG